MSHFWPSLLLMHLGKQKKMAQVLRPLLPCGRSAWSSRLMASAWSSHRHCNRQGINQLTEDYLSLSGVLHICIYKTLQTFSQGYLMKNRFLSISACLCSFSCVSLGVPASVRVHLFITLVYIRKLTGNKSRWEAKRKYSPRSGSDSTMPGHLEDR